MADGAADVAGAVVVDESGVARITVAGGIVGVVGAGLAAGVATGTVVDVAAGAAEAVYAGCAGLDGCAPPVVTTHPAMDKKPIATKQIAAFLISFSPHRTNRQGPTRPCRTEPLRHSNVRPDKRRSRTHSNSMSATSWCVPVQHARYACPGPTSTRYAFMCGS